MSRRAVRLTDPAIDDLNDAREWLHQYGAGTTARKRYESLSHALRVLRTIRRDTAEP